MNSPAAETERQTAIAAAAAAVAAARPLAAADPERPRFHFRAPAAWMNDPNGLIHHQGHYHLFYQHHPYDDTWGAMHWGHARSADLAHWEHLPVALWPSKAAGEEHCFSGSATVNELGQPMLFYTSIGPKHPAGDGAEQWAALGSPDLLTWRKHAANPVLTEALHGDLKIYEWRDPYVFAAGDRRYLVLGGNRNRNAGGQGVVGLYRAEDRELTRWSFRGVLYQEPDPAVKNVECPNFFRLGHRWVLLLSTHGPVHYLVGDFDAATEQFTPVSRGLLDHGRGFYAPQALTDPKGRVLLWGWVMGWPRGQGWNGCLSLPRVLSLGDDDTLRQEPAPELDLLHGPGHWREDRQLADGEWPLPELSGEGLELCAELDRGTAATFGLRLHPVAGEAAPLTIAWANGELLAGPCRAPLALPDEHLELRVFADRVLVEVFANDRLCFTLRHAGVRGGWRPALFAAGGAAWLRSLSVWPMHDACKE